MNYFKETPLKKGLNYNTIIEISKGTKRKNELVPKIFNKLSSGGKVKYRYPYNYGIFPSTLSTDGDPVDAIIWGKRAKALSIQEVTIIGLIKTTDEKGLDPKVICLMSNNIKISEKRKNKILNKIMKFFNKIKETKKLTIDPIVYSRDRAVEEVEKAYRTFIGSYKKIC